MQVTRTSMLSGIKRTLDLPITDEQVAAFRAGALIQHAFPDLPADKREFILTGITAEEWSANFSDQPEETAK
jgi:hypothetical protein